MSKQWKLILTAAVACVLTAGLPQAETGGEYQPAWQASPEEHTFELDLVAVQVNSDANGQPIVRLDSDGPVEYESFVLDGPHRLVVDLPGMVSRLGQYSYPVESAGLVRIRAAQHQLQPFPVARVVFDLDRPLAYTIDQDGDGLVVAFGDDPMAELAPESPPVADVVLTAQLIEEPVEAPVEIEIPAEPITVVEPPVVDEVEVVEVEVVEVAQAYDEPAPAVITTQDLPQLDTAVIEAPAEPVAVAEPPIDRPSRSVEPDAIEQLMTPQPVLAAPTPQSRTGGGGYESKKIVTDAVTYSGKRISLNLVDADIKQVFRLFHEISGLNFVLDPGVTGRVTIVLDNVPWDQALDLILKNNGLDKELERNVLRIATTVKLAQEAASRKQLKEAEELEVEPVTLTRTLSYAKAIRVQEMLRGGGGSGGSGTGDLLSPRGTILVDERTNTVIVSDIPKKVEAIDQLLRTLDAESPQVMIEARIVETSKTFSRDLGVTWGFNAFADSAHGTSTGLSFPHNASARYALNLPAQDASTLGFSFGNVVDSFTLDVALNALETTGNGRVISAPKVAAQNNERAEIEQGLRFPIVNTTATEINVEFISASLKLTVTPQITAEGTVLMEVIVENNSADFSQLVADVPSIRTQRAVTKVLTRDGGTTVIGGIFFVNEADSETGVPWFRKVPVFGWLFRNQNITKENRELLIFITPKIIKLG